MAGAKKLCGTPNCSEEAVVFEPVHMCVSCARKNPKPSKTQHGATNDDAERQDPHQAA